MKETRNGIFISALPVSFILGFLRNPLPATSNRPNGGFNSKKSALIRVHPSSSAFPWLVSIQTANP
jgi:hypothetical protein